MNWGIIGISITILIFVGKLLYNKYKEPIVISPKQIIYSPKKWDEKITFNIRNRTEKVLYSIWVKLQLIGENIKQKDIELESELGDRFNPTNLGSISIDFDIIRFDCLDSDIKKCIYLLLRTLSPNEPKSLILNIKSSNSEKKQKVKIKLQINEYSKEAPRLLTKEGQTAYPFKPPENIKLKSIYLLMKRD